MDRRAADGMLSGSRLELRHSGVVPSGCLIQVTAKHTTSLSTSAALTLPDMEEMKDLLYLSYQMCALHLQRPSARPLAGPCVLMREPSRNCSELAEQVAICCFPAAAVYCPFARRIQVGRAVSNRNGSLSRKVQTNWTSCLFFFQWAGLSV